MNYTNETPIKDKEELEVAVSQKLDFEQMYKERRYKHIEEAKIRARHNKRAKQKQEKKMQHARDVVSESLIKEQHQKEYDEITL